jgi:hypothetical protein
MSLEVAEIGGWPAGYGKIDSPTVARPVQTYCQSWSSSEYHCASAPLEGSRARRRQCASGWARGCRRHTGAHLAPASGHMHSTCAKGGAGASTSGWTAWTETRPLTFERPSHGGMSAAARWAHRQQPHRQSCLVPSCRWWLTS